MGIWIANKRELVDGRKQLTRTERSVKERCESRYADMGIKWCVERMSEGLGGTSGSSTNECTTTR
jgi:hypothetical protein